MVDFPCTVIIILEMITEWDWHSDETLLFPLGFQSHYVINSAIVVTNKVCWIQKYILLGYSVSILF